MDAIIVSINRAKGRAVARTGNGEYVLFELFAEEPELYDDIKGRFDEYSLGDLVIKNVIAGKRMEVYIQNYGLEKLTRKYLEE
ncbi:MAG: hypothetical protein ACOX0D_00990 [Sphaerochaeta sp.]|jgi:hypothetical protein